MANGVLIVNKPEGFTSSDVVAKLRGIFGQRKIGHTGTLDPNATGVLPICLGSATKICDYLTDHTKTYIATAKLGFTTDTQDVWGTIIEEKTKEAANLIGRSKGCHSWVYRRYRAGSTYVFCAEGQWQEAL